MWLVWHLPLFWLEGSSQQGSSILTFLITLLAFSVIFTWVCRGTSGSLFAALLFHTGVNVFWAILEEVAPTLSTDLLLNGVYAGLWVAIALVVVAISGSTLVGEKQSSSTVGKGGQVFG